VQVEKINIKEKIILIIVLPTMEEQASMKLNGSGKRNFVCGCCWDSSLTILNHRGVKYCATPDNTITFDCGTS
jgi:hypothetical protein